MPPFFALPQFQLIATATVALIVGILGGGWTSYNGWVKNRMDAKVQKEQFLLAADTNRLTASGTLMQEALSLVTTLRSEIDRVSRANDDLRTRVASLETEVRELKEENAELRLQLAERKVIRPPKKKPPVAHRGHGREDASDESSEASS